MQNTTAISQDQIIGLFVLVDDMLAVFPHPSALGSNRGRHPSLTDSEIVTMALLQPLCRFADKRALWAFLSAYCRDLFPGLPGYKSFVQLTNSRAVLAGQILLILCALNRKEHDGSTLIDSTALPVCKNKRISSHRVAKGFAKRSKTTTGWFYGFRLHLTCDAQGRLLSFIFTPGNTDERKVTQKLLRDITGLVIADAGYVSQELQDKLREEGVRLFTAVRKNMRKLMTVFQHLLLKSRQRVEMSFSVLKENLGLVSSLSRSVWGHFARYLYACLAYCIKQLLQAETPLLPIS